MARSARSFPVLIYGTAWKQDATAGLVEQAVRAGYRAIDTANQKKHYREDFVGEALLRLYDEGVVERGDLWLQSKFTSVDGQDQRLPYDPRAPIGDQVRQSFESTLKNLHTDKLDSFLLHGPADARGMTDEDWEVWSAMQGLYEDGRVGAIGVSNVSATHVQELLEDARVKPMIVQNRCFAVRGWDKATRGLCAQSGIVYQGFSLLTANPQVVGSKTVAGVARRLSATPEQVIFRFAKAIGILPLTGTTDERHMKQDLAALEMELPGEDVKAILALG